MSDNPRVEVTVTDPLGDRASSAEIAKKYEGILPDDT
jgi:hypothetical protein